jgi:YD repeat-containing protein
MNWSDLGALAAAMTYLSGCSQTPEIERVAVRPCHIDIGEQSIDLDYDAAGHQIARRERRSSFETVWAFQYAGDKLVDETQGSLTFHFEYDADGHHVATTRVGRDHTSHIDWRGQYKDGRLALAQDYRTVEAVGGTRDVPGTATTYTYDRLGRVTREIVSLTIGGTVTTTYDYDDSMKCRYYADPLWLPEQTSFTPCPTTITIVDEQGRRVSRPTYRDGRRVQDDNYTYSYDSSGRLTRMTSLRVPGGSADRVFSYSS